MFFGRRHYRKGGRRRWIALIVVYMLILVAGVGALWYFVPRDVVDAVRDTYFNPSAEIDP